MSAIGKATTKNDKRERGRWLAEKRDLLLDSRPIPHHWLRLLRKVPALGDTALKIGWCASPVKMLIYTP